MTSPRPEPRHDAGAAPQATPDRRSSGPARRRDGHRVRRALLPLAAAAALTGAAAAGARSTPSRALLRPAGTAVLGAAVTVGGAGNEPLVRAAPDGTLYVAALQHLYVSTSGGQRWQASPGSLVSGRATLASDSSIQVDAHNRLYQTLDYPYAGVTAVCTSDTRGASFSCDPAALPGGTDRMWLALGSGTTSYLVSNEGLYQTVLSTSTDRGATYLPQTTVTGTAADPTDGPLLVNPVSHALVQPIIDNLTNQTATANFESGPWVLRVFTPGLGGVEQNRPVPLRAGGALPAAAYDRAGTLWVAAEQAVRSRAGVITAVQVRVARSSDDGRHWSLLPPVPVTVHGTATFVALGAGRAGHVGVVFFHTAAAGDPGALPASTWDAEYAESADALSAQPHWAVTTVDTRVHHGVICATAGCTGAGRFAGDFLDTSFDQHDRPLVVWMRDAGTGTQIRFAAGR